MINRETEKAFNDIRSILFRRGVRRCEWRTLHTHTSVHELHWMVEGERLYRRYWRIHYVQRNLIEVVKHWIENEVGISLETESEKVSRIMDAYDT